MANGPPTIRPAFNNTPEATGVRYDYLKLLMTALNKDENRYRIVFLQEEFDFEAPANDNGQPNDGSPGNPNGEINGRLTMRDVSLARNGAGVKTINPKGRAFKNLYVVQVSGAKIPVTRGWTQVDAKIRGSEKFRFINTHLEAFDPNVREAQAKELFGAGGPAKTNLPVVLVGDISSDDNTVTGDDRKAYLALKRAGFRDRSTKKPMSCCIDSEFTFEGKTSDFDHHIDHILTRDPALIKRIASSVVGRTKIRGQFPPTTPACSAD